MNSLAFFMWFDPMYFVFLAPAILLAILAQMWVKSAYARGNKRQALSGMSGAQAAQEILDANGITDVRIEPIRSFLGDHYDSRHKVLRLSPDVYNGRSLSALGIAAHEVGHAIQDARNYTPLVLRNGLVPIASIGSNFSFILVIVGAMLSYRGLGFGEGLAIVGLVLFSAVVVFQLINLPVEFNASKRARQILLERSMVTPDEDRVVAGVLNAAAMTYVAATITAVMTMLYYAYIIFGRRN